MMKTVNPNSLFRGILSVYFVVGYVVCYGVSDDAMTSKALHHQNQRQLQKAITTNQTLNYRATYKADFQHLRDFQCTLTEPPILELTCYGTNMSIVNVSHTSISCNRLDDSNINNGTTYQCTTSCALAVDCTTVYENFGSAGDDTGIYGSIEFICEGDDYRQVDADYIFTSGPDGECTERSEPQTRNYHVARLGVSCPTNAVFADATRTYVYDDTYFECQASGSISPGFALDLSDVGDPDVYFCLTGDNCLGEPCRVPYDALRIRATLPSFLEDCVERLVELTAPPTNTPAISTSTTEYVVQFQASWGRLYDTEASQQSCQGLNPTIMITCGDVDATISYVSSTDQSMICNLLSGTSDSFLCTGNSSLIENNFTSVVYTCIGPKIPSSQISFPGSVTSCSGNTQTSTVTHAVNLGIWCQLGSGPAEFYHTDWAAECLDSDHDFENTVGEYGFDIFRYTCRESVTFIVGSTTAQTIRNVSISTDEMFPEDPEGCYTSNVSPSSPIVVFTLPPTSALTTSTPSSLPTIYPLPIPSHIPSVSPVVELSSAPSQVVVDAPFVTSTDDTPSDDAPVIVQRSSGSDNSIIGIAIGCVGGGFALAALIAMILFIKNREPVEGGGTKPKNRLTQIHSEFRTENDFSSTQSRTATYDTINSNTNLDHIVRSAQPIQHQPPIIPINEGTSNNVVDSSSKPEISLYMVSPDTPYRNHAASSRQVHASPKSQRTTHASNHILNVKDQCRSVAIVRSSSPTFISQNDYSNVPIAVAMGVATTSTTASTTNNIIPETNIPSSNQNNNNTSSSRPEPSGRKMVDG